MPGDQGRKSAKHRRNALPSDETSNGEQNGAVGFRLNRVGAYLPGRQRRPELASVYPVSDDPYALVLYAEFAQECGRVRADRKELVDPGQNANANSFINGAHEWESAVGIESQFPSVGSAKKWGEGRSKMAGDEDGSNGRPGGAEDGVEGSLAKQ